MEGIILAGLGYGVPFSINLDTKILYIHDTDKKENGFWTNSYTNELVDFHTVLEYALTHEEMHLVFDKIGESQRYVHSPPVLDAMYWTHDIKFLPKEEWK